MREPLDSHRSQANEPVIPRCQCTNSCRLPLRNAFHEDILAKQAALYAKFAVCTGSSHPCRITTTTSQLLAQLPGCVAFDDHTVASSLTERMDWQIRNTNMKQPLSHLRAPPLDPKQVDAGHRTRPVICKGPPACRVYRPHRPITCRPPRRDD